MVLSLLFVVGCGVLGYLIFAGAKVEVRAGSTVALSARPAKSRNTKADLNKLSLIAHHLRIAIRVVAGLLMVGFAWLNVRNWPISEVVQNAPASTVLKVAIVLYFFSWLFGTMWEVDVFEVVYFAPPDRPKSLTKYDFISISALALSGGFVLYATAANAERMFAGALSGFFVVNVLLWLYTVRQIVGFAQISMFAYNEQRDYCGIEQVNLMFEHARGDWQRWRFMVLLVIVVLLDVVTVIAPVRAAISNALLSYYPPASAGAYFSLLPDVFVVLFLLVGEGWIWFARIKVRFSIDALSDLREKYKLTPVSKRSR